MKTIPYCLVIIALSLLASCTVIEDELIDSEMTVGIFENTSAGQPTNKVSADDILEILKRDYPQTKGVSVPQYELTSYVGHNSDTLMYILNLKDGGGWKIYSSDRRTPPVLAEGESGYFSLEEGSPAVAVWIDCMAKDIERVRNSTDRELTFTEEEINLNKAFWSGEQPSRLRPPIESEEPIGHWEETIHSETIIVDSISHMVAKWDQNRPYNEYCPSLVYRIGMRAATGCVAVAGSQMLLFLHNKIGLPTTMVSQGICTGNIFDFYRSFSNSTSTVWSDMSTHYLDLTHSNLPEAIMMGYVGMLVNMNYCETSSNYYSWAIPANLKSNVFEPLGIGCSRSFYDEDIVESSLLNQMPVVVSASNLMVPVDGLIHCFVIDGYRITRTRYTHVHYFVLDENPSGAYDIPDDYITYTYSTPQMTGISINWGWWSQWQSDEPVNEGWYTLTGNWTVEGEDGSYDYNYYRNMTYGFEPLDD